jgi:hypothetical protein
MIKAFAQSTLALMVTGALLLIAAGCSAPPSGASGLSGLPDGSNVYGSWQSSSGLEQLSRESETSSSGSLGSGVAPGESGGGRFREEGEPVAIHQLVNRVLVDDEYVKITLQSKTADALGDAGFILTVENRYEPLTSVGHENYCYITPVLGTWTVDGVAMEARADDRVYPGEKGQIYLYFDELSTIEELVNVEGQFEIFYISDWWNPLETITFNQP